MAARQADPPSEEENELSSTPGASRSPPRAVRALQVMRGVARVQSIARNETELLDAACEQLVSTAGYLLAWIGYVRDDPERSVHPMAHAGVDRGYLAALDVHWSDTERGRGPTGTAIRTTRPVVARDILNDANFGPWRQAATERGYASCIALPLLVDGRCIGAMSIYSKEPDAFDEDEQALLEEVVAMVSQSVAGVRARAERERAITALEESEERFRQFADNVNGVFWVLRASDSRVLYVNDAYERVWGLSRQEAYRGSLGFEKHVHPEDRARVAAAVERSPEQYEIEHRLVLPDRGVRWIWIRTFPVRDGAGSVVRLAGIAEDVTDRRLAEEARRRLEAQIEQARRLEGQSRLAGGIAHDFNNLLGVIMNYAAIATHSVPDGHSARQELTGIVDAAQHAARLTRQLMLFSQNAVSPPEVLDLNAAIESMRRVLMATAGANVTLTFALDPETPPVRIVAAHLEQILLNVVVNAREAMPSGGAIRIETRLISTGESTSPRRSARIVIADSGRGMTDEQRARAFEPFYSTKNTTEASGLGLAIVYGAVKQAGGRVGLQSAYGAGTRVEIDLPAAE